jgi:hypothetical protein
VQTVLAWAVEAANPAARRLDATCREYIYPIPHQKRRPPIPTGFTAFLSGPQAADAARKFRREEKASNAPRSKVVIRDTK